ncbi:Uncharacterized protein YjaZ [Nocardiopsis flavescens]|uniref:Uncharacterized protein YjaZ n=1 Tax=Nocardiopsis flavescens TaxID=758803 RepID=A0A1M6ANH6_9ACTN|nr:DUF2268 domain-containing putative Zn-dependent protease [Nocardiopsis flavescens]SHI38036.1 Uncharacterized protein YjaZ [Nocardiopsis flavescens]
MTITVVDTRTGMEGVLRAPAADRRALLEEMLEPSRGMYRYHPGEVDLADVHLRGMGFPLDRDGERCLAAVGELARADAWNRIGAAMEGAAAELAGAVPGLEVHDITVLLTLGDPGDAHFTDTALGVTGFGGIPGYVAITLWPSPENLERLESTAVHELHHNLRWAPGGVVWNPATVTVGEHIVGEGLADAFARQLYGDRLGHTRIGVPHLHDDAVFAKVVTGLEVTGMENFTAWVHGDESARRFGTAPVGLPAGAGYAAGTRLVDAYLAATGRTAAQALRDDHALIIDTALGRTAR